MPPGHVVPHWTVKKGHRCCCLRLLTHCREASTHQNIAEPHNRLQQPCTVECTSECWPGCHQYAHQNAGLTATRMHIRMLAWLSPECTSRCTGGWGALRTRLTHRCTIRAQSVNSIHELHWIQRMCRSTRHAQAQQGTTAMYAHKPHAASKVHHSKMCSTCSKRICLQCVARCQCFPTAEIAPHLGGSPSNAPKARQRKRSAASNSATVCLLCMLCTLFA
jgi:hypothetical protein